MGPRFIVPALIYWGRSWVSVSTARLGIVLLAISISNYVAITTVSRSVRAAVANPLVDIIYPMFVRGEFRTIKSRTDNRPSWTVVVGAFGHRCRIRRVGCPTRPCADGVVTAQLLPRTRDTRCKRLGSPVNALKLLSPVVVRSRRTHVILAPDVPPTRPPLHVSQGAASMGIQRDSTPPRSGGRFGQELAVCDSFEFAHGRHFASAGPPDRARR